MSPSDILQLFRAKVNSLRMIKSAYAYILCHHHPRTRPQPPAFFRRFLDSIALPKEHRDNVSGAEGEAAQDKGWTNEWKAFAKSIREGGEPPIPYEQLIGVTKSTFAAVESIRQGMTVGI